MTVIIKNINTFEVLQINNVSSIEYTDDTYTITSGDISEEYAADTYRIYIIYGGN